MGRSGDFLLGRVGAGSGPSRGALELLVSRLVDGSTSGWMDGCWVGGDDDDSDSVLESIVGSDSCEEDVMEVVVILPYKKKSVHCAK